MMPLQFAELIGEVNRDHDLLHHALEQTLNALQETIRGNISHLRRPCESPLCKFSITCSLRLGLPILR
jgi:hypothetical protein